MTKIRWEESELEFLKDNINSMNKKELSIFLNKSVNSINRMINRNNLLVEKGKKWTAEEENILKKYYPTARYEEFLPLINRSKKQIMLKANKMGIKRISKDASEKRKYTLDENYFKVIDSPNKAYYLGWAFTDGNVISSQYRIRLNSIDKEILEKMLIEFKSNSLIYQRGKNSEINICSKLFVKNLINLGCIYNKTYSIKFPQLPKNLIFDFLKGCFDGDGCYVFTEKTKKISFCSASYDFIKEISNILKLYGIKNYIYNNKNVYSLQFSSKNSLKIFLEKIINTDSDFLERKKSKMILLYNYSIL